MRAGGALVWDVPPGNLLGWRRRGLKEQLLGGGVVDVCEVLADEVVRLRAVRVVHRADDPEPDRALPRVGGIVRLLDDVDAVDVPGDLHPQLGVHLLAALLHVVGFSLQKREDLFARWARQAPQVAAPEHENDEETGDEGSRGSDHCGGWYHFSRWRSLFSRARVSPLTEALSRARRKAAELKATGRYPHPGSISGFGWARRLRG